jgi:hypothetical protein
MTRALILVVMLYGAWRISEWLEWHMQSPYCWPSSRRALYMMVALWFESCLVYVVWRALQ